MKTKINNVEWQIIEVSNDEMNEFISKYRKVEDNSYYAGYTSYVEYKILLNAIRSDLEHVLRHELMHAYLFSFGIYSAESYDEEDLCNVSSRSSRLINQIVDKYFKNRK